MDILFTGYTAQLTNEMCVPLLTNHRIVVASDDTVTERFDKKITPFNISAIDVDFRKLFNTHSFDIVVFLSQPVFSGEVMHDEYQKLESCLKMSSHFDVKKFVYITTDYCFNENNDDETDFSALFNSCNSLCEYYNDKNKISVISMKIPCMYGKGESVSLIGSAISDIKSKASVSLNGAKQQSVGLISQKDVGELLLRVVESWPEFYTIFSVPALSLLTFGELGDLFKNHFPTCRITYANHLTGCPAVEYNTSTPKNEFDWIPLYDIRDEISEIVSSKDEIYDREKPTVFTRIRAFFSKHYFVLQLIEVLIGFILMEFLNKITSTTIQFRYVDFRLIYIVVLATFHGMKIGLISAGLASISLLAASVLETSNWTATIYDISTWLPFIFFFIVGAITGYVRDRLRNDNRDLKDEKELLEEKFVLLNDFYSSALVNKDRYKNQIMSYRDSYGRLFDVTQKLDNNMVERVFLSALESLEGILNNKSICIYGYNNKSSYARLLICSKEIRTVMNKSMDLNKYRQMVDAFVEDEVWANRERLVGYPEYAMPIYNDGVLVSVITVQKVSYDQLEIYYENLIKIVGGLIKMSLIRAIEYRKNAEETQYISGTRVLLPEYFTEIIKVRQDAQEHGNSEYSIMKFNVNKNDVARIGNILDGFVRETDYIGLGHDGCLYVCLNQASPKEAEIVFNRIRKSGVFGTASANNGLKEG